MSRAVAAELLSSQLLLVFCVSCSDRGGEFSLLDDDVRPCGPTPPPAAQWCATSRPAGPVTRSQRATTPYARADSSSPHHSGIGQSHGRFHCGGEYFGAWALRVSVFVRCDLNRLSRENRKDRNAAAEFLDAAVLQGGRPRFQCACTALLCSGARHRWLLPAAASGRFRRGSTMHDGERCQNSHGDREHPLSEQGRCEGGIMYKA